MAKVKKMLLTQNRPICFSDGKWKHETIKFVVNLMTEHGKYAMVRRPGCAPFICLLKDLSEILS